MIIICITNKKSDLSQRTLATLSYTKEIYNELKIGKQYTVYAMSVYNNIVYYFIQDVPVWYPADFFQVVDGLLYNEWYFKCYGNDENELSAIWGYKELLDPTHYHNLLEREPEDVRIFEKRKQEMDEYEALSSYIPKKSESAHQPDKILKSQVYTDPVDQDDDRETLQEFLEKYLSDKMGD